MLQKVSRLRLDERDTAHVLHLRHPNALFASVAEGVVLQVHVTPPHIVTYASTPPHHIRLLGVSRGRRLLHQMQMLTQGSTR
jgi:hypothetical protein